MHEGMLLRLVSVDCGLEGVVGCRYIVNENAREVSNFTSTNDEFMFGCYDCYSRSSS
jgi:hypothetical protein